MEEILNLSQIARTLHIKELVLIRLKDYIPFADIFSFIATSPNQAIFWNFIDGLPPQFSLSLHGIDVSIDTNDHDFPEGTIGPLLQDFWGAHCISSNKEPTTSQCLSVTSLTQDMLNSAIKKCSNWSIEDDNYILNDFSISFMLLKCICESFASGGFSWFFLPFENLRASFSKAELFLSQSTRDPEINMIRRKMREFRYSSSEQLIADLQPILQSPEIVSILKVMENPEIPEFEISMNLLQELREVAENAVEILENTAIPPSIGPYDDWIMSRSSALIEQMKLPLQQRSAYVVTPQILQARAGLASDAGFEPGSLAELLLSDQYGNAVPLPYSSCQSEIPSTSPFSYCTAVLKKFAAKQLEEKGKFQNVSETSIDVLADVLMEEVRKIAQGASAQKIGKNSDVNAIINTLKQLNCDVTTLDN